MSRRDARPLMQCAAAIFGQARKLLAARRLPLGVTVIVHDGSTCTLQTTDDDSDDAIEQAVAMLDFAFGTFAHVYDGEWQR